MNQIFVKRIRPRAQQKYAARFTLRLNERNVLLLYVQSNIIIPAPSKIKMFCSGQLLIYAGINSDSLREEA